MSEARKRGWRVRPGYVGLMAAGALGAALLFLSTSFVILQAVEFGEEPPGVEVAVVVSRAAWGLLFGAVAVLVGLAGVAQRETPFTKGLFVTVISGFALAFEIFAFGGLVWADGFIIVVLAVILPILFSIGMAVVCTVGRSTFAPSTT